MKRKSLESYQQDKKSQKISIIMRTNVLMILLNYHHNYTFIISNCKRRATKTMNYYPIDKIYNENGVKIYDTNTILVKENKTIYCRNYVIELMINEMEKRGMSFTKYQTKKAEKERGNEQIITLTKITNFYIEEGPNAHNYKMTELEELIGKTMNNYLMKIFLIGNYEKIQFGNNVYSNGLTCIIMREYLMNKEEKEGFTREMEIVIIKEEEKKEENKKKKLPSVNNFNEWIELI